MSVLLVKESYFGNGSAMIDAVINGVAEVLGQDGVTVVDACDAQSELPEGLSVLVVSAPTHELSLPTPRTRKLAREQGSNVVVERGVREWIAEVKAIEDLPVFAIDTCTKKGALIGTASKATVKNMKKQGFKEVHRGPSFFVSDAAGPFLADQLDKAYTWGKELAEGIA